MKKNTKKKFRDIRNAVVMMCVMVAMMSTASYAWFTMTDSPTVAGMKMTAASTSGLQISNAEDSGYDQAILTTLTDEQILKPVTPGADTYGATSGYHEFKEPVYVGNTVESVKVIDDANVSKYVAKYTVYLRSTNTVAGTEDLNIGIICGDLDTQTGEMKVTDGFPSLAGSLVRTTDSSGGSKYANYAIRVGIVPDGTGTMYVWEPNNDDVTINGSTKAISDAVDRSINEVIKISSNKNGIITADKGRGTDETTSVALFTMKDDKTQPKKVDIYFWLQGSDKHCVDQIQADDLEAQIQFTVVEATTTP